MPMFFTFFFFPDGERGSLIPEYPLRDYGSILLCERVASIDLLGFPGAIAFLGCWLTVLDHDLHHPPRSLVLTQKLHSR